VRLVNEKEAHEKKYVINVREAVMLNIDKKVFLEL
jgi:hypothetical protein